MTSYYQLVDANKARSGMVIAIFIVFITAATYLLSYALGFDLSSKY